MTGILTTDDSGFIHDDPIGFGVGFAGEDRRVKMIDARLRNRFDQMSGGVEAANQFLRFIHMPQIAVQADPEVFAQLRCRRAKNQLPVVQNLFR